MQIPHQRGGADGGQVVDKQHVLHVILRDKLAETALPVPVVDDVDGLVVIRQERHKSVAEGLLHHHAAGAVGHVGVVDDGIGVVAGDERAVLQAGRRVGLVIDDLAPQGLAVVVHIVQRGLGAQGMIGHHLVGIGGHFGVLVGIPVEGAQEAVILVHGVAAEGRGSDALGLAELLVGVVRAGGRPVVVGAEVDILGAVRHQRVIQRHGLHVAVHIADDLLLGVLLVSEDILAVQLVRQADAGAERDRQHIHGGLTRQRVSHGVHVVGVLFGGAVHVGVHLVSGIAHPVHGVILLLFALQLDLLVCGGNVVRRVVAVGGVGVVGIAGLGVVSGCNGGRIRVVIGGLLVLAQIDDDQHHGGDGHHQRDQQHQGRHAPAVSSVPAHFR